MSTSAAACASVVPGHVIEQSVASMFATEAQVTAPPSPQLRHCKYCDSVIPTARLNANPRADACVPCLESKGDVPTVKSIGGGVFERDTAYTETNSYIERHLRHERHVLNNWAGEKPEREPEALLPGYGAYHAFEDTMIDKIDRKKGAK